jgi:hypothetical protein
MMIRDFDPGSRIPDPVFRPHPVSGSKDPESTAFRIRIRNTENKIMYNCKSADMKEARVFFFTSSCWKSHITYPVAAWFENTSVGEKEVNFIYKKQRKRLTITVMFIIAG